MKQLQLEIITPSKIGYKSNIHSLTVPGSKGSFQVLFNHAPIISSLDIGKIIVEEEEGSKLEFATSGGTIEVVDNKIIILAESFEKADEIDTKRAEKAKERAEERLKNKTKSKIDDIRAEMALKRAINRLKVSKSNL